MMEEDKIATRIWLRSTFSGLPDRLVSPDVTSLKELSRILNTPVSAERLANREFRKQAHVTLVSSIRDKDGGIVCERDVIAVGNRHRSENYYALYYGIMGDLFSLHRAGESLLWNEATAAKCTRVASHYEDPDLYARLFNTHPAW